MQQHIDYALPLQLRQDDDAVSHHSSSSSGRSSHQSNSATPQRRAGAVVRRYTHNPYSSVHPDGRRANSRSKSAAQHVGADDNAVSAAAVAVLSHHSAATSAASSHNNSFAAPSGAFEQPAEPLAFDYSAAGNNSNDDGYIASSTPAAVPTLHVDLVGRVTFVPYPADSSFMNMVDMAQIESDFETHGAARLFVGQLPHKVTQCQLDWLFASFAGVTLRDCERITKKNTQVPNGPRLPTGCIHANLPANRIAAVCALLHKKILIDDSGVWFAATPDEESQLAYYVALLKADPRRRFPGRPAESLVVQQAESRFFPSQPRWVSNAPEAEAFLTYSRGFYSNENKQSNAARAAHAARLNSNCYQQYC